MCPRRFASKSDVPRHEQTHTGEKPYACAMCPMRFSRKSHVPKHERTHATATATGRMTQRMTQRMTATVAEHAADCDIDRVAGTNN